MHLFTFNEKTHTSDKNATESKLFSIHNNIRLVMIRYIVVELLSKNGISAIGGIVC